MVLSDDEKLIFNSNDVKSYMLSIAVLINSFLSVLWTSNLITTDDYDEIIHQKADKKRQIILLWTKLEAHLTSLDGLVDVLKNNLDTEQNATELEELFRKTVTKSPFSHFITALKRCYIEEFREFRPLSFEELTFDLDQIWINLQLENNSKKTSDILGCIDCVKLSFENSKIVICKGDPGSSKSTLSTYLCYQWAKGKWKEFDFVFLIQLQELAGQAVDRITAAVLQIVHSYEMLSEHANCVEKLLKSLTHRCLVILDGYDEANDVCNQLNSLLCNKSRGFSFHILLTSRPWAVTTDIVKCTAQFLNICPLKKEQQTEYIQKHLSEIGKKSIADVLIEILSPGSVLQKLSETALMLCYICFYYSYANATNADTDIDSLTSLYLLIVPYVLERYYNKLSITFDKDWFESEVISNLGKVALLSNDSIFTHSYLSDSNVDIDLRVGAGLLVKTRNRNPGQSAQLRYAFPHYTMQQFFAALYIILHYWAKENSVKQDNRRIISPNELHEMWVDEHFKASYYKDYEKRDFGLRYDLFDHLLHLNRLNHLNPVLANVSIAALFDLCKREQLIYHSYELARLHNRATNPSRKKQLLDVIICKVGNDIALGSIPDPQLLQLCHPHNFQLFSIDHLCCYLADLKQIHCGHEWLSKILPHCRRWSLSDMPNEIRKVIIYDSKECELTPAEINLIDKIATLGFLHNGEERYGWCTLESPEEYAIFIWLQATEIKKFMTSFRLYCDKHHQVSNTGITLNTLGNNPVFET